MPLEKKQGGIFRSNSSEELSIPFSEAFPQIQEIDAEISETGEGNEGLGVRRFNRLSAREYVNCSNHRCGGKGFSFGDLLREMIAQRQIERKTDKPCLSNEDGGRPCPNHFAIVVRLELKPLS